MLACVKKQERRGEGDTLVGDDDVVRLERVLDVAEEDGGGFLLGDVVALHVREAEEVRERHADGGLAWGAMSGERGGE